MGGRAHLQPPPVVIRTLKCFCVAGSTLPFGQRPQPPFPLFLPILIGLAPFSLTQAKYDQVFTLVLSHEVTFVLGGVRLQPLKLIQVYQEAFHFGPVSVLSHFNVARSLSVVFQEYSSSRDVSTVWLLHVSLLV